MYGALYPHRPLDRWRTLQSAESDELCRQARSPVYETLNRAERGRGQAQERRQEKGAGSRREAYQRVMRYLQANLSGMFDTVNTKVGEIAGEVGMERRRFQPHPVSV